MFLIVTFGLTSVLDLAVVLGGSASVLFSESRTASRDIHSFDCGRIEKNSSKKIHRKSHQKGCLSNCFSRSPQSSAYGSNQLTQAISTVSLVLQRPLLTGLWLAIGSSVSRGLCRPNSGCLSGGRPSDTFQLETFKVCGSNIRLV